ncbi:MAG: histidinol-phosphate transaminase [Bacteroidota bacterium]
MDIENLVRSNIKALKPYRAARHDHVSGVLLDANENSFGSALPSSGLELNRYPDPYQQKLRTKLAALYGVRTENMFLGVGSDEAIDLLIRIFCEPAADSILVVEPTYGMYRVAAGINNVEVRSVLLNDDFQMDLSAVTNAIDAKTKIIFCCSPNNPTANLLRRDDILTLCNQANAIVVVDEAYLDFADSPSLSDQVNVIPNLVILRTLSKAWGLAGIRLGCAIADPAIISLLLKIKSPYNINALTSAEALKALENREKVKHTTAAIIAERGRLAEALRFIPYIRQVFPSDANFLLVRFDDAPTVYSRLVQKGIIVRDRSSEPKLANCLRITIGTPEQNDLLIKTMKELSL